MKKILLPTDFSEISWNAIKYALQLFQNDICEFYVLHTYTPIIYDAGYGGIGAAQYDIIDSVKENSEDNLKLLKRRIKREFNNDKHSILTFAVFNTLIQEISNMVENNDIHYIVMGTKGASGLQEILFGSNTVHVIKAIKCPILVIPEGFTFKQPHQILFPTDYEIQYKSWHVNPVLNFINTKEAAIHILNASFGYDLSEKQKENKGVLVTLLNQINYEFHSVSNQTVEESIANFQVKYPVNLLFMINNEHSFFENLFFKSKINQIGFHLKIPFLVVPEHFNSM